MALSRRSALRASWTVIGVGTTGCVSSVPIGTDPGTSVDFTAEVLQQATTQTPGRIVARLSNTGSEEVSVGFGPALLFTDNSSEDLEWPTDLVLVPDTETGPDDEPSAPTDGCWRFPDDGYIAIQSSLEWRKIAPGQSLTERYSVYTRGDFLPCLPEGVYRFQDKGSLERESQPMVLTLVLTINGSHELSVTAKGPSTGTKG